VWYFDIRLLEALFCDGESSPSVESMGRGMAEVRELSPFSDSYNECNRLVSTITTFSCAEFLQELFRHIVLR
jgi:hypothetical protein